MEIAKQLALGAAIFGGIFGGVVRADPAVDLSRYAQHIVTFGADAGSAACAAIFNGLSVREDEDGNKLLKVEVPGWTAIGQSPISLEASSDGNCSAGFLAPVENVEGPGAAGSGDARIMGSLARAILGAMPAAANGVPFGNLRCTGSGCLLIGVQHRGFLLSSLAGGIVTKPLLAAAVIASQ